MSSVYLISDTHFGHQGVCNFLRTDGVTKLRPWTSAEEMDEALVSNWNSVVKPKDKVYHLGDVVINRKALITLSRLNGDKVLIRGNHDIFKLEDYTNYFRDVRGYHIMDNLILSHIPIHPSAQGRFRGNIHGHLHANIVKKIVGVDVKTNTIKYGDMPDPWYQNVSVEQINYTPILFERVRARFIESLV